MWLHVDAWNAKWAETVEITHFFNFGFLKTAALVYFTQKIGCIHSLDWTTGLEYWTGLLD